jgi:MSHA pilin protein MshA
MKVSIKNNAQGGFTLIELIVVIVILGILAATALPKFADLGSDARVATLNAAKGSLAATAAMGHGKYLAAATPPADYVAEGVTVTFATAVASGYPKANSFLMDAAGITSADYTIIPPNTTGSTTSPGTSGTEIAAVPKTVAGTTTAATCYVKYTEPTAKNSPPAIVVGPGPC